ncbi:MAG: hypothetical protein KDK37_11215 [Leptospiraceae bacterium]|nr:hypothetical protein [Leptospiraceae bacterium]MCB1304842.1 hypothetical protein [Leptospiraceae bacterium]
MRKPRSIVQLILPVFLISLAGLKGAPEGIVSYNSEQSGLEGADVEKIRAYTTFHLKKLRKAISPRYIYLLDWEKYAHSDSPARTGILFTYQDYRARNVFIAGNFSSWKPMPMHRNPQGVFYLVIPVRELEEGHRVRNYEYRFQVDGIWQHDPTHPNRKDDGMGGYISTFFLDHEYPNKLATVHVLKQKQPGRERIVEFAVHSRLLEERTFQSHIENLSLVGEFNHWNPETHFFKRGEDGVFRLRLHLRPGEYLYMLVADGKWILDPLNPDTRFHRQLDELVSYFKVE